MPVFVSAAEYYVDIESLGGLCSDSNPGTIDQPWCTIAKANSDLMPGDTVYIREGVYTTSSLSIIDPVNSGTPGNYITYSGYGDEEVIITGAAYGADLSDTHYIVVDGIRIIGGGFARWIIMAGNSSTHNIVKNCEMRGGRSWAGIYLGDGGAHYNKIINNTINSPESYCKPDDVVYLLHNATYNLIEGNSIYNGPHNAFDVQAMAIKNETGIHHNVIRNNYIRNLYHTGLNIYTSSNNNLVEGNMIVDSGDACIGDCSENVCGSERDRSGLREHQGGLQLGASDNIFRRNVFINNGIGNTIEAWDQSRMSEDNMFYQNTYTRNYYGTYITVDEHEINRNVLKNNIYYNNSLYEIYCRTRGPGGTPRENYFINNNILGAPLIRFYPTGDRNLSYLETTYPDLWYDNMEFDPMFIDEDSRNLRLQTGSQMIDAGAFLTKTTSEDSGNQIPVEDARYFMDGWGIIEGDEIQLEGQTETVRVTGVDYNNNILTVDTSLSWSNGQGVSLTYKGSSPDIGAYEYDPSSPPCTNTCKEYVCSLYDDCSSASPAVCLEGYCCSGTCSVLNDNTPPSIPTNLEADPVSTIRIDLEWDVSNDPETGVDHYLIYRDSLSINQTETTSFSDTGLNPDTIYTYEVSAVNHAGTESQKSASVQKSTLPLPMPQTGVCRGLVLLQHYDQQTKYGEDFSHVYDFSGNGNDGSCTGMICPTFNQNGMFGGAFQYDGVDDYFDSGSDDNLNFADEITMSAWVYSDNYDDHMGILTRPLIFPWFFYIARRNPRLWVRHPDGNLTSQGSNSNLNDSTWYHLAAVYDDSQRTVNFYLNGEPDGSGTYPDRMSNTTWRSLSVGRCYYGTGYQWNGLIDEVAVWNRTLSSHEIESLYNESGPVTCQDFCIDADLNCDTVVDIFDLQRVASDFGKTSGFNYPNSDSNGNGEVDIFDVVFVASRFT
jgi:hypothetical protein